MGLRQVFNGLFGVKQKLIGLERFVECLMLGFIYNFTF